MTDSLTRSFYRRAHAVLSVLWLGWASYRLVVDPLASDSFGRAGVRLSIFVATSMMIVIYAMVLAPTEDDA